MNGTKRIVQKRTANRGMERVPFHDREMEISIQYRVMLIRQSNDQILMRCYIIYIIITLAGIVTYFAGYNEQISGLKYILLRRIWNCLLPPAIVLG